LADISTLIAVAVPSSTSEVKGKSQIVDVSKSGMSRILDKHCNNWSQRFRFPFWIRILINKMSLNC